MITGKIVFVDSPGVALGKIMFNTFCVWPSCHCSVMMQGSMVSCVKLLQLDDFLFPFCKSRVFMMSEIGLQHSGFSIFFFCGCLSLKFSQTLL